ncbi:MAG: alpha/beta hydrolase [Acidobacteriota bacterium]
MKRDSIIPAILILWLTSMMPPNLVAQNHKPIINDQSAQKTAEQNRQTEIRVDEGYVTTDDGVRLFYQKIGNGASTVIIPGGLFLFDDFKQLAKGRTLIFYDMRNRGRSDSVSDNKKLTIQDDVRDVEKIRSHFRVEKFSLIGYSYLGKMVVMYAIEHPQYIERIVQLGPISIEFGTKYPDNLIAKDDKPVLDPVEMEKLNKLREEGYNKSHPKEYCEREWLVTRSRLVGDPANATKLGKGHCELPNEWGINLERHFQQLFTSIAYLSPITGEVKKLSFPVLTIHGTQDRNAPYGGGREWAATLPNARLITIKGAAHNMWVEAPETIFPAIDTFFNGKWPELAEKVAPLSK